MADEVRFYKPNSPYYEFSNYFVLPQNVTIFGLIFPTTEHAYQALKFYRFFDNVETNDIDWEDPGTIFGEIIRNEVTLSIAKKTKPSPDKAKYLDCQKTGYPYQKTLSKIVKANPEAHIVENWNEIRDNIMRQIIWCKITQFPTIKDLLIGTERRKIIEDSPRDSY